MKAINAITYKQLDQLLLQLGFSRQRVDPKWLRYVHSASDTVIALVEKNPNERVRVTDAVSACRHLVEKGLASAEELGRKLAREPLPKVSMKGK